MSKWEMSKWKCGICNTGFDNYQAQGFDGIIYCPLCYFKELYKREKNKNQQLKKQKDDVVEYIKEHIKYECDNAFDGMQFYSYHLYDFNKEDLLRMLGEIDVED